MALLNDILEWSRGLDEWQRDALRRVFINGSISPDDIQSLVTLVKEQYGCGPKAQVRPIPLDISHLPAQGDVGTIQLLRLENLKNVNRFPENHGLELIPDRLNVLFGDNGAGKSGFARVLKNACRARHRSPVLPNAFDETRPRPVPSGDIVFIENGNPRRISWAQGQDLHPELARVAVYDHACGNDYLAKEGESEYQPYGLPQLNRLIAIQRQIQTQIGTERDAIQLDRATFNDLAGDHQVGTLITRLDHTTDPATLTKLAALSAAEIDRSAELTAILSTLDPEPEAKRSEQLAQRIETSASIARSAQKFVSDTALEEVKNRDERLRTAKKAWTLAQQQLHKQEDEQDAGLLPGTGNEAWKLLFEAAENFSIQHAYVGHEHPYLGDNAKCVLCQSYLDTNTKDRLKRFSEYVSNEASLNLQKALNFMTETKEKIAVANFSPLDEITTQQLREIDPLLAEFATTSTNRWNARRSWVLEAVQTGAWNTPRPDLPEGDPLDVRLSSKAERLRARARELREALDREAKRRLEKEATELKARERLGGRSQAVLSYVRNAQARKNLSDCYTALDSRGLSRKTTEFASRYVTTALAENLNEELFALGFKGRVEAFVSGRTDAGHTMVTLKIKGCDHSAHQILSEGEQRIMGLAIFLAEVRLQGHASAVVFDDPTTSLDHRHRRRIAARLAELSRGRQVVIFTHDAVFLGDLGRALMKNQQLAQYLTVGWSEKHPGYVEEGMTWETADWKNRLEQVEATAKEIKSKAGENLDNALQDRTKDCYTKLRGTIERAVREVYMNETILPFSDEVSVNSFGAVFHQSQEEWERLMDIYERCCEVTDAHDTSGEHQLPIPDPDDLIKDIESAKELISNARKSKAKFEEARSKKRRAAKNPFSSA